MTELIQKQNLFVQNNIATRLKKIANNLDQIRSLDTSLTNPDFAINLIRESQFFIEWTADQMDIDQAAELVEVGRVLAYWKLNWEKICSDATSLAQVIQEAGIWSKRVLEISGVHTS